MQKVVKMNEQTYKEMREITQNTGVSTSSLIDNAWESFKGSKQYSYLILYGEKEMLLNGRNKTTR